MSIELRNISKRFGDVAAVQNVSFKVAAKQGSRYTDLLAANREIVAHQVTENIFERHFRPLFLG